jgi:hypothetical protein
LYASARMPQKPLLKKPKKVEKKKGHVNMHGKGGKHLHGKGRQEIPPKNKMLIVEKAQQQNLSKHICKKNLNNFANKAELQGGKLRTIAPPVLQPKNQQAKRPIIG